MFLKKTTRKCFSWNKIFKMQVDVQSKTKVIYRVCIWYSLICSKSVYVKLSYSSFISLIFVFFNDVTTRQGFQCVRKDKRTMQRLCKASQESRLMLNKYKSTSLQVCEIEHTINCENGDMQRSPQFTLSHKLLEFLCTDTVDCRSPGAHGKRGRETDTRWMKFYCFSHFWQNYLHFK